MTVSPTDRLACNQLVGDTTHWRADITPSVAGDVGWISLGRAKGPNLVRLNKLSEHQQAELPQLAETVAALERRVAVAVGETVILMTPPVYPY